MKKVLLLAAVLLAGVPAWGLEKGGMPDLAQVEQTCLPTSTANLLIWFGAHGYPKLIPAGGSADERADRTVHLIMADTGARYDIGTEMEGVTSGITDFIHRAGYACDVEYRGIDGRGTPFTQDWLHENDRPDTGFILLLTYCQYHRESNSFSDAWNAGHAVTLVNAEPGMLLIHDPAHPSDATGRKIVTPYTLKGGTFVEENMELPVAGLMMLSGSLLEAPPNSNVMLTGAVRITMRPGGPDSPSPANAPNAVLAGTDGGVSGPVVATASGSASAHRSWWSWCLSLFLGN